MKGLGLIGLLGLMGLGMRGFRGLGLWGRPYRASRAYGFRDERL